MTGSAAPILLLAIFLGACAQTLTYEASAPEGSYRLKEARRGYGRPFIGNHEVDREAEMLPRFAFDEIQEGFWERVSCWRFKTRDGAQWSARTWKIEAVLTDQVVLLELGKLASRVIDAEDLERIEAFGEFAVQIRDYPIRAKKASREKGRRLIVDVYREEYRPAMGDARYLAPGAAPPEKVYGFDEAGNAFPLDYDLIRGFLEGTDTSAVVLGNYRTVPLNSIHRWEFDKEWGPWSSLLVPYLAGRWVFTNRDYVQRCEVFP